MGNLIDLLNIAIHERDKHNMATKNNKVEETATELQVIPELTPAAVIGVDSKVALDESHLPEEFRGATLETIETGFAPTVKWNVVGNFAGGVYQGMEVVSVKRTQGKTVTIEENNVYNFEAKGRRFGIWGTTVLDKAFSNALAAGIIKPGYMVLVVFVGEIDVNQPSPCKMFQIKVVKKD